MRLSDTATIQIPFSDIDAFNIVYYGNYAKYFEIARRNFLHNINYDIKNWKSSKCIWLIVESNYKYLKPITYDQKIKVICYLDEYKYRLKISYKIKDFYSNKVFTTGHTIQVPVDLNGKYSKIHQNELIDIITKIKKNEIKRKTKLRKK